MEGMFAKGYAKCHCIKYDYYKSGFCEEREGDLVCERSPAEIAHEIKFNLKYFKSYNKLLAHVNSH